MTLLTSGPGAGRCWSFVLTVVETEKPEGQDLPAATSRPGLHPLRDGCYPWARHPRTVAGELDLQKQRQESHELGPRPPQRRKRTPWPSASRRRGGWARDLGPAACRAPLRGDPSECAGERAGGAHTGLFPCRLSLERPVGLSLITLFDSRVPSSECGPLLGGVHFLLDLLPHFFTPHSLGFPCSPQRNQTPACVKYFRGRKRIRSSFFCRLPV